MTPRQLGIARASRSHRFRASGNLDPHGAASIRLAADGRMDCDGEFLVVIGLATRSPSDKEAVR